MWLVLNLVLVLDDAAGLNVGKRKSLGQVLVTAALRNNFLEGSPFEIHYRAVGLDGSRAEVPDFGRFFAERNFDVAFVGAFLSEDFDANVIGDGGAIGGNVFFAHIARAIENHGVRAFAGGIVFQREVFWSDREPVIARGGFSGREDAQSSAKKGDAANESLGSIHGRSVLQVPLRNGVRGCTSNRGSAARLEGAPLPSGELNANLTHGDAPVNSAVMLASR